MAAITPPARMQDLAFLGLRATSDFTTDGQRPKNWRETILRLYPNGKAPLTALLALMKEERTDDPEFNWFCKHLPTQAATITGLWSDVALTIPVAGVQPAGAIIYVQMAEDDAKNFIPSNTVLLRNPADPDYDAVALVEDVVLNGANSYLRINFLDVTPQPITAATMTRILIIGTANAEGALIGQALSYDPYKVYNYTQIFRNALEITRTADLTRLRTGDAYKEAKREALELHSIEMEKAFLFGVPTENVGPNGKPLRTTAGIIWTIKNFGGVVSNFPSATNAWMADGLAWLEYQLMLLFRTGEQEKLAFVGDSALLGINRLARTYGTWNYTPETRSFGINVVNLVTPFGQITMKTHPLFSHEPTNQHSMLIFEPKNIRYRYITDTTFYSDDKEHGHNRYDAKKEEYLTECGLEYHFPQSWGWFNSIGIGTDTTGTGWYSMQKEINMPVRAKSSIVKGSIPSKVEIKK